MNKSDKLIKLLVFLVSIVSIIIIVLLIINTTGKLNQGKYRINDFVVESTVNIYEHTKLEELTKDMEYKVDISNNNKVTLLIPKIDNLDINEIYIDNIKVKDNILVYENNKEKVEKLNLTKKDSSGQYLFEFNILNENIVKDAKLNFQGESIIYDGRMLKQLNKEQKDIEFKISFNLNLIDSNNKKYVCKVNLKLPTEDLISNGISITREDLSKLNFVVK